GHGGAKGFCIDFHGTSAATPTEDSLNFARPAEATLDARKTGLARGLNSKAICVNFHGPSLASPGATPPGLVLGYRAPESGATASSAQQGPDLTTGVHTAHSVNVGSLREPGNEAGEEDHNLTGNDDDYQGSNLGSVSYAPRLTGIPAGP